MANKTTFAEYEADVLVIGTGLSGLRAAVAAAYGETKVIAVGRLAQASGEVMGFNAPVLETDSILSYEKDLRESGQGIGDEDLVHALAAGASGEVAFLEKLGLCFDRDADGEYHCLHTLGCTLPRLVHRGAVTGRKAMELMREVALARGVSIHEPVEMTHLLKNDGRISGALGFEGSRAVVYHAGAVILCSGGCGGLYENTTYPSALAGSGYAMAYDAGAALVDMEFQQFEPCCFVYPESIRGQLVPTTLLRSGARLRNGNGLEFMSNYGLKPDNAQKGELARAIATEIFQGRGTGHGGVYYDMTMLPRDIVTEKHSIFYEPALKAGIDLMKQPAEMAPAAHTCLGGVWVDAGASSTLPGLFAAGEAMGGLHGANRIGGCAGAETLVFGRIAGESAADYAEHSPKPIRGENTARAKSILSVRPAASFRDVPGQVRSVMSRYMGLVKTPQNMAAAQSALREISLALEEGHGTSGDLNGFYSAKNMAQAAQLCVEASVARQESRGVFFRNDFPQRDDLNWTRHVIIKKYGEI